MQSQSYWVRNFSHINAMLLTLVVIAVFVLPAIGGKFAYYAYPPVFTAIFLISAFTISKKRKSVFMASISLILILWISILFNWELLKTILRFFQFIFFFFLVMGLIKEISFQPKVTPRVIVDAITGYLLLGFAFGLLVTVVALLIPDAYNTGNAAASINISHTVISPNVHKISESIYYTFTTFSTTGYGDILPVHPLAKTLAILIGISGQLYIAIIIAMLVGKYASSKN